MSEDLTNISKPCPNCGKEELYVESDHLEVPRMVVSSKCDHCGHEFSHSRFDDS